MLFVCYIKQRSRQLVRPAMAALKIEEYIIMAP